MPTTIKCINSWKAIYYTGFCLEWNEFRFLLARALLEMDGVSRFGFRKRA